MIESGQVALDGREALPAEQIQGSCIIRRACIQPAVSPADLGALIMQ